MATRFNRRRIMRRAWHLFRTELGGIGCVYRSMPRIAMSIALREAWAEKKAISAAAALPRAVLAERIEIARTAHHAHAGQRDAIALAAHLRALEVAAGLAA